VAKAIAHITGTALRPGVSRNNRWYTKETIAKAVARAQERIAGGEKPMVMLTVHPDGPIDAAGISASLTGMSLDEAGNARFTAAIADTAAGRDMAALADTSDGQVPHLRNVSIRGNWLGIVRKVRGPEGGIVETGSDLELDGLEFTPAPGVQGAQIDTFAWAGSDGQTETDERVLIAESVEAAVTFTETAGDGQEGTPDGPPDGVREALALFVGAPLTEADSATPAISKRGSGTTGGGRVWADPGYQADKKQRYDITTKAKALTGWRYINQASKASKYNSAQLKRIKGRIRAALAKFGVKAAASTESAAGWVFDAPCQVPEALTDAVAEWYGGDPAHAGSWSVSASNGPVNLNMSSYSMDPADLDVILRAAAAAACDALKALDPDMGGDVDVPGVGSNSDTDGDADAFFGKPESAPDDDAAVAENAPATETAQPEEGGETPAPAGPTESEDSGMETTATTTEAGAGAPAGLTPDMLRAISEATAATVTAAFEARDKAKDDAKKARKDAEAREAAETAARKTALTEALAELGIKPPATETAPAQTPPAEGTAAVTETVDEQVERRVGEAITEFKQQLLASGAILPARAGLVVREHAVPEDAEPTGEELRGKSDDDLMNYLGGAMAQVADAHRPVGAGS
jgi:hypothetical protein